MDEDLALRKETFETVRRLVAEFPRSAFPLGLMGTVYNQYGNSTEAEKWWMKCLERDLRRADVFDVLCVGFLRKGEFEKVVELSRRVLAVAPGMPGGHRRQAEALLELGELDEALAAIEAENRITPNFNDNHVVLGRIHLQRKEYERAVEAYTRALELRPGDERCYFGLATATARLGRDDQSAQYMAEFTRVRSARDEESTSRRRATDEMGRAGPILAETLVDVGRTYDGYGHPEKAEAHWRRGAEVDPKNTSCRLQLVDLYRRTQRSREALDVCGQLTEIEPGNALFHRMTGVVLADLRRFDEAEQAFRKTIELAPEQAGGYALLARLFLVSNRRVPEAMALAQKAVDLEPSARHYVLLSRTFSRNKELDGAVAAMKRAAELAPDDDKIQDAYHAMVEE